MSTTDAWAIESESGTELAALDASGNLSVAGNTAVAGNLSVTGTASLTGAASFTGAVTTAAALQSTNASATGAVAARIGPSATEGLEVVVVDKTVSPAAVETAVFTVPAGAVILSVQGNVETALTGGGTTVTYSIGTAADPDKYGTPASDGLTVNTKSNSIPDWAVLGSAEAIVVTGAATGGASDGNTALTVGSVRVVIVYAQINSLDDA